MEHQDQQNKSYVLPIAMMFALFFMISFVTGLQNPFGVIVKNQFMASNLESQLGNLANFIAYAFMGIPAGKMLERIGYKKTALAAIAVGGKRGNQLLQFGGAINSIGATIVPVLVGYLIGTISSETSIANANPALFLAMGIFALAFIVLFSMNIPEPHAAAAVANGVKNSHSPLSFRHFVLGAIAIFLYVGIEVGIPNIANLFMTGSTEANGLGIDTTTAGSVVGTYWFLMFIGRLTGGSLGAKFSSKGMLSFVSLLGLVFVLLAIFIPETQMVNMPVFKADISFGLAQVPMSIMFLILCGLCTSVMWGGIFNLATEGLGKYTAAASGIFMVMVCGGGILPAIQGWAADAVGYIQSYWVIVLAIAYLLFYALVGSKNVNTDIDVA